MGLRVIVSGAVAATPAQGGASWAILQYLLGLRALGADVLLVEPVGDGDLRAAAGRCAATLAPFDLGEQWCLVAGDGTTAGRTRQELRSFARRSDLLLNVSGMLEDGEVLDAVGTRVFVDLDPAFVQLWHSDGIDMRLDAHDRFVTISDAVGETIPDCGRSWLPSLPVVALSHWEPADSLDHDALTTVANWRGYGSIEHDGVHYGQKAHSVRALIELPQRVAKPIAVALSIHPDERADLDALRANGWRLLDPVDAAGTADAYRRFVRGSWAEIGIAKSGYVVSRSGWFSDRSACYLAAGRPVVAQGTGWERRLPTGQGLFAFDDVDGAVTAVEALLGDYASHRDAARAIAVEYLDAARVLPSLLDRVLP